MSSSLLQKACSCPLRAPKHLYEYLFSYVDCSDYEISADKSLFLTYVTAFLAANLISRHAKCLEIQPYFNLLQDEKTYQTKHLYKDKSSAVLITN